MIFFTNTFFTYQKVVINFSLRKTRDVTVIKKKWPNFTCKFVSTRGTLRRSNKCNESFSISFIIHWLQNAYTYFELPCEYMYSCKCFFNVCIQNLSQMSGICWIDGIFLEFQYKWNLFYSIFSIFKRLVKIHYIFLSVISQAVKTYSKKYAW